MKKTSISFNDLAFNLWFYYDSAIGFKKIGEYDCYRDDMVRYRTIKLVITEALKLDETNFYKFYHDMDEYLETNHGKMTSTDVHDGIMCIIDKYNN